MNPTSWLELGQHITSKELKGAGAEKVRARAAVNTFCSWATQQAIPFPVPLEQRDTVKTRFEEYAATLPLKKSDGEWSKDGQATLAWAHELLRRKLQEEPVSVKGNVTPPEDEMRDEEQEQEGEETEDELEEGEEEGDEEEELEEERPRKANRRVVRPARETIVVEVPRAARGRRETRTVRERDGAAPARKLFGRQQGAIRIYVKDATAKLQHIEDYEPKDLGGGSVKEFIENDIHPRFYLEGEPFTDYVAVLLTPRGDESDTRERVRLENPEEEAPRNDPFSSVKQAFSTFRELQQQVGGPEEKESAALKLMREKAKESTDSSMMMMLAFMEMMQKNQTRGMDPLMRELLERMDRAEQRERELNRPPPMPMPMHHPPPPPESQLSSRMMELALAKFAQPAPSLMEQAKDLATVRMALGDGGSNPQLLQLQQQVTALQNQLLAQSGGRSADGFKDALTNFEQVMTAVKSFAPQIAGNEASTGGGGLVGFLKGILTPDVGKAIASVVTRGGEQPQGQQQVPQQPPQQAQQQLPPPQQQPQQPPQPQQRQTPPAVIEARNHFLAAQTPPVRAEKFADLITQMFLSQQYTDILNPALEALQKDPIGVEELKVVRKLGMNLVLEMKPEWARPEFVDSCISALAAKLAAPVPPVLVATRGRWTFAMETGEGRMPGWEVFMLDTVAREVKPEVPAPKPIQLTSEVPPEALPKPPPGWEAAKLPPAQPLSAPPPERKKRVIEMDEEELAAHMAAQAQAALDSPSQPPPSPPATAQLEPQLVSTPPADVLAFERR